MGECVLSRGIPKVPTKTSELTNNSGFITSASVPTKVSQLTNDSGYITSSSIPKKVSQLTNDSGYVTSASLRVNWSSVIANGTSSWTATKDCFVFAYVINANYSTAYVAVNNQRVSGNRDGSSATLILSKGDVLSCPNAASWAWTAWNFKA